tara:strand:- start:215 stop:2356 length:2142 start_codon:yes stop_codon:yes gene_type:complete
MTSNLWSQVGKDINGESTGDFSGRSIAISDDGQIIAIGANGNDGNGIDSGHVRVFQYINDDWRKLGDDIDGESSYDNSGFSIAISSDGRIVAIGAYSNDSIDFNNSRLQNAGQVRIYKYENNNWNKLGNDIDGEDAGDYSGYSISLSDDGSIVAIGAYSNDDSAINAGHVRIYQYIDNVWRQLGKDIDGEKAFDFSGFSTALSSDGDIIAIGAYSNDGGAANSGHVRIYQYIDNDWRQLGKDIDGENAYDYSGYSIDLSSNGKIVAISARRNDGNGDNSGHVRVFEYKNNQWQQLGDDIDGENPEDYSGQSISLSNEGNLIAIGSDLNGDHYEDAGHVRIFEYKNNQWHQLGDDIDGEFEGDFSGISVDIEYSGKYIYTAIGAYKNLGSGNESGHVRVYRNSNEITIGESNSSANEKELQQLYIAYFSRPCDPTGLNYWKNKRISREQFAASMYLQPEFKDIYGKYTILNQLNQIYLNLFNRNGDAIGLSYWINQINMKSLQPASIANDLIWAAENKPESSNDFITLSNKTNAAIEYTSKISSKIESINAYQAQNKNPWVTGNNFTEAKNFISGIDQYTTHTSLSIENSIANFINLSSSINYQYLIEPTQSNIDKITGLKTNLANAKTFKITTNEINSVSHEISNDYSSLDINYKDFVYNLYEKVLDREPDLIGMDYWLGRLSSGAETRYEVLLGFSESSENKGLFIDQTCFC